MPMSRNIQFIISNHKAIFNYLINIKISKNKYLNSYKNIHIPEKWQIILLSDGSLTQNVNSFIGSDININVFNSLSSILVDKKKLDLFGLKIKTIKI